jgi:nucleoside-diphosphate-sugar epimerase
MNMQSHLILGFTGGIGRAVATALSKREIRIKALVRDVQKASRYTDGLMNIEIVEGDGSVQADLDKAFDGVSHVHYCINMPYNRWEQQALKMLKICVDAAIRHQAMLVFPGNVYVYGHAKYNPVDEKHPHAAHTKKGQIRMEMEEMLALAKKDEGLNYTIVRMPDFYGPFVVNTFSEQLYVNAIKGKSMQWIGDLDAEVELIFIEDGGEAMVMAALSDKSNGEVFNIPGVSGTTARKYLHEIARQAGSKSKPVTMNSNLIFSIVGIFMPILKEVKEMLYLKREKLILNGEKFSSTIGKLPATDYNTGIEKTLNWVRSFYSL